VARVRASLGHVVLVMARADAVWPESYRHGTGLEGDERKGSSWGRFGSTWLLIDFDRAWEEPRGVVGALYYGRQERLARRWMALPAREAA
jgi:hypothetical protein